MRRSPTTTTSRPPGTDELEIPASDLLDNDSDVDMDTTLTIESFDTTSAGGATITRDNGTFTYDWTGVTAFQALIDGETATDTFTYTIDDGNGGMSTATVTISVNGVDDDPVAGDVALMTDEGSSVEITEADALAASSDPDAGSSVSFVGFATNMDTQGTLSDLGGGTFVYNPNGVFNGLGPNETGTDTFDYTVMDDTGRTSIGTVTVTINGINDAPIANDDEGFETDADMTLDIATSDLTMNDTDPDESHSPSVDSFQMISQLGATITRDGDTLDL